MTLYYYCRLYLSCPLIPRLQQLAQYQPSAPGQIEALGGFTDVSDQSVNCAWALLDMAAKYPKLKRHSVPCLDACCRFPCGLW